ncbi:MAG: ABC transporter permease [Tissierellia bacterium]|nr:ABC transporter permease [Tissierellia bacterium]
MAYFIASLLPLLAQVLKSSFPDEEYAYYLALDNYILFKLLISPIIVAALTSRVVEMEDQDDMWKVLFSVGISYGKIFWGKFILLFLKYLLYQVLEWGAILFLFHQKGSLEGLSSWRLIFCFFSILSIHYMYMGFHYLIALKFSNQLINLSLSILEGLAGIIGIFLPQWLSKFLPFSWMGFLMNVHYISVGERFMKELHSLPLFPLLGSILLGSIFLWIGYQKPLKRGE